MKKVLIVILLVVILCVGGVGINVGHQPSGLTEDSFLRIHIRANSNLDADQDVKYLVKDEVVKYLTPYLANANTKQEAMKIVNANLSQLANVASLTLQNNGYNYGAEAKLTNEYFPTRCYDDVVLPSGDYDSLILYLGEGVGNNWWCVVYPPLCFVPQDNNSQNVVYRSKIVEIIKHFLGG